MKQLGQKGNTQVSAATSRDQLVRLTPENAAPTETIINPFVSSGIRIKDDNPNPFMNY